MGDGQLVLPVYAGGLVLIVPSEESVQLMLNTLHEYCAKWRLTINRDKNKDFSF